MMGEAHAKLEAFLGLVQYLVPAVMQSARLPYLQACFRRLPTPPTLRQVCSQQLYLKIVAAKPREALVRLLMSDHPFKSELGRRLFRLLKDE